MKLFMSSVYQILRALLQLLLLLLLLQLLLLNAKASAAPTNTTCKHTTDIWGDPNPNIYYVCSVADQIPLQLHCPQGRGFFNGLGYLGCVPYEHWPACQPAYRNAQQEQHQQQQQQSCKRNSSSLAAHTKDQPWATLNPNQFYICANADATPMLLSCASGKGFVQTPQTVGCADWMQWRRQMGCEAYF
ncbi:uncharacterized protein LOC108602651 [Drosophila busckii]|uniref:uncharacterized protein LOC108602651 n=1 Tax=Drosophila busckii TaxID=30019 RepID=UPI00083ECE0F|nr:uncharacterized protein LOC108602651 [Drosophila busckii]